MNMEIVQAGLVRVKEYVIDFADANFALECDGVKS